MAEQLGQPFMPWQAHWALVVGEMIRDDETGIWVPAYPEAFDTLMRQQGKTLWNVALELDRALLWEPFDGKPQAIAYTGQTGLMARQKFRKEHWPMISGSPLRSAVARPRFAAEDTGIDFVNGSILTIWSNSEEAGHGLVVDLGVEDEIWADIDDRREQALLPATATRPDRQKIKSSTAGTDESVVYLRSQAAGRAAVVDGRLQGLAYLEFSFGPEDDPEDPRTWRANMPALGYTITERTVQTALDEMRGADGDLSEFCRAWGNITKRTGRSDRVIPDEIWIPVLDEQAAPKGSLVYAVDAQPDQTSASIAVVDDRFVGEIIAHGAGVGWTVPKLVEMIGGLVTPVALDLSGPAGHLAAPLTAQGVTVVGLSPREVAYSCAEVYGRIGDGRARIRVRPTLCEHCSQVPITAAVEGATRQPSGDAFRWARKSTQVDISPLMALTLAVGVQAGVGGERRVEPTFIVT